MPEPLSKEPETRLPALYFGGTEVPEGATCEKHPDRPAAAVLYYPTRYACAECVRMSFDD